MGTLLVSEKTVVVPGQELATGMDYLPGFGAYRDGEHIVASQLGLLSVEGRAIKIIPLSGKYIPKNDDTVIAQVVDITLHGWRLEINSAYSAMLTLKDATSDFIARDADLTAYFNFGDWIVAGVANVTTQKLIDLTMKGPGLRKLGEGMIVRVGPSKIPRIIGKGGSMVSMIKEYTGCRIIVGQNGVLWIQGSPEGEMLAAKTIKEIEQHAHRSGLTERIKEFLGQFPKPEAVPLPPEEERPHRERRPFDPNRRPMRRSGGFR
ncbi:RNA-binding protein [Candidatus Woesearchaeota archaeon]|nr:RNA-binding protein [Candidatus Woesearchaeota archaeon]